MRRTIKLATLGLFRNTGLFEAVANSNWRKHRLLILCYHGISLEDEHLWRPQLYMQPELLEKRLETLRAMRCSVLPLGEALDRLQVGDLPPRSVAITFDDGTYDFYKQAYPLLQERKLPVTVYQTTYYAEHEFPIFNLICSYLLWKKRDKKVVAAQALGFSEPLNLGSEISRHKIVRSLIERSESEKMTGKDKNALAAELAKILGLDYAEIAAKRIVQLMNARELAEVSSNGVDIQLHTHRHRSPEDELAFSSEVEQNRDKIKKLTGKDANHFCYPSGIYRQEFVGWLEKERVVSATTCDGGLATRRSNRYLLPRLVDTSGRSQIEFESWLSGVGPILVLRRSASQKYIVREE